MKKSLVAFGILAACSGAATAQSSVTIYGIIDLGVTKQNGGTTVMSNSNGATGAAANRWDVRQGYASRLGFRGIEDLGGGMRAAFNLEHRFNPDTGTSITTPNAPTQFWYGRSTVALQGPFGEVLLGRDYIPAFWVALATDPFNYNTIGALNAYHTMAGYSAIDTSGTLQALRNNNSVIYKSPVIAGGLTASFDVSAGEGGRGAFGRSMGANVEYKAGPIYVGGAWDQTKNNGVGTDPQLLMLTGAYDFGVVRPILGYARNRRAIGGDIKEISLGVNAPIGASAVLHTVAARLDPAGGNNNTLKLAVGGEYRLSKRTSLYADVATAKNQGLTRTTGVDFGLTHLF